MPQVSKYIPHPFVQKKIKQLLADCICYSNNTDTTNQFLNDFLTSTEKQQLDSRGWRDRRIGEYPPVAKDCRPADYTQDLSRGTLEYNVAWRNYSFHKINISAGTVIRRCNFSQAIPNTECIVVLGLPPVLTFIDCNLCNVKTKPEWILQNCLTVQSWIISVQQNIIDETGKIVGQETIEKRQFIAQSSDELPQILTPPPNVITSRTF